MEKKRIKTKFGVRSVVKAKVGDMEENTREVRRSDKYTVVLQLLEASYSS